MMTQPIVIFKDLTSETAPAGGNVSKTGFSHEDRQRLELFAAAFRAAKKELDPQGMLNPGVLIDP